MQESKQEVGDIRIVDESGEDYLYPVSCFVPNSERDLIELQREAVKEGLPYQTYVSSIIHKFINGSLVEAGK